MIITLSEQSSPLYRTFIGSHANMQYLATVILHSIIFDEERYGVASEDRFNSQLKPDGIRGAGVCGSQSPNKKIKTIFRKKIKIIAGPTELRCLVVFSL